MVSASRTRTGLKLPNLLRARTTAMFSDFAPIAVVALIVAVGTSALWRFPGIPLFGDWAPPASSYIGHVISVWDPFEHNGTISIDFRAAPLFLPLAALAGHVDSLRFHVVNDAFIIAVIAFPPFVAYGVARRVLGWSLPVALIGGIAYGFNPWAASDVAAGHFGVLLGYGLLPIAGVVAMRSVGLKYAVRAGMIMALTLSLDIHTALIAGAILIVGRAVRGSNKVVATQDISASLGLALAGSAYWLIPTYLALRHLPYQPGSVSESVIGQATLAQQGDLIHVLSARSIWYIPFSNGLFDFGVLSGPLVVLLLLLPLLIMWRAVFNPDSRRAALRWCGVLLVVAGVAPQLFAHFAPAAYATLGNLPLGAAFRDPSELTPLYVLGLAGLAASVRSWKRLDTSIAVLTCLALLAPWATGDLHGDLHPLTSVNPTIAAVQWIDARVTANERVLWLPPDLYQEYPGANFPVNDPVRFWSQEALLNPVYDAAYDFSPQLSSGLINLEEVMAVPMPGSTLAELLSKVGVRFVVARTDPGTPDLALKDANALARSGGIHLVAAFGGLRVYQPDISPIPEVVDSDADDGGWHVGHHNVNPSLTIRRQGEVEAVPR